MTLLPEVREQLLEAAERQAVRAGEDRGGRRPLGWLSRLHLGNLALALTVAGTLAVAIGALVTLRPRASSSQSSAASSSSLGALEAKLGVLRRPQTPADRRYPGNVTAGGSHVPAGVVTSLTRLAASINTTTGRVEVYVVIRKLPRARPGAPALRAGSDVVNAVAVDSHADALAGTALLTARQLDAPTSAISTARPGARQSAGVVVGILPDGVTRVTWRFTGAGIGILHPHPSTVSVPVHDNVAVVQSLRTWGPLARATWYGAAGQVIASADGGALTRQQLETIRSINTTRHRPIDRALRADYSLFRSVPPDNLAHDPRIPIVGTGMGLNYWQIRYIPSVTGLDGPGLWITPGTNAICISDPQASTCGKLAGREPGGFIGGTTSNGHQTTISGLVPDGNPTVTIVLADHTHKTVPVIHNVYEATATGRIVTIISRNASGQIQHHSLR